MIPLLNSNLTVVKFVTVSHMPFIQYGCSIELRDHALRQYNCKLPLLKVCSPR